MYLKMLKGKIHRAVVKQAGIKLCWQYHGGPGADAGGWDLRI